MSVPVAVLSWHDTQTEEMNRANDNESCDFVYFSWRTTTTCVISHDVYVVCVLQCESKIADRYDYR